MFRNISRTIEQMNDGPFLRVLLISVGTTILLMAVMLGLAFWGAQYIPQFGWNWVDRAVDWLLGLGLVIGSIFLILPVSGLFVGLMLDPIAEAVEDKYYPDGPGGRSQPFWPGIWTGIRFVLIFLVANLAALIVYLIFLPIGPFLFLAVNGYLVGREYFELAGHRLLSPADVRALRRGRRGQVFLSGLVIALLMMVPVVNLLAPLFGTALMVHEVRRLGAAQIDGASQIAGGEPSTRI
jgi:CysZ protein